MAKLTWKSADGKSFSYIIKGQETILGRDPVCHLILDDIRISRRHCSISKFDNIYIIQDMGSRNGTWINQNPIFWAVLQDRMKIKIGKIILTFHYADEPAKA